MSSLIARFAESTFWLGRYIERAENLARILDANETFARDQDGAIHWSPIVRLHADDERFHEKYQDTDAESVVRFYVLDQDNPTSIISCVAFARENARALRHLISTEMWMHLNVFYHRLLDVSTTTPMLPRLSRTCGWIKESCQSHMGIVEGTLYRDQAWYFHQIGKLVERADQTTRLLDISYLTPRVIDDERDREVERAQWNAVLRSVAGYHAFRRVHPRGMEPEAVASFLLFDESFPRSVSLCIGQIDSLHLELEETFTLQEGEAVSGELEALGTQLRQTKTTETSPAELHTHLDIMQQRLIALSDVIAMTYFGGAGARA